MKKCISFVICMCVCTAAYCTEFKSGIFANNTAEYADMENHWAENYAARLFEENIYKGVEICGKYYFKPDKKLTRAEFIVLLLSAMNIEPSAEKCPFADKNQIPQWAVDYANTAYKSGIIDGARDNGKLYFYPDDTLTRIELIQIVNNALKLNYDYKAEYTDMYLVPNWAKKAVGNMTAAKILDGYADNTVRPYVKVTGAYAAKFVCAVLDYMDK